jgi:hypothetical protein
MFYFSLKERLPILYLEGYGEIMRRMMKIACHHHYLA